MNFEVSPALGTSLNDIQLINHTRRYMAGILSIRRKTQCNAINQSINNSQHQPIVSWTTPGNVPRLDNYEVANIY